MKVILKQDVKGLGREGDLKEVKDGYARNFLLPTGKALVADKGAVANWERHRDQREERDRSVRAEAEATAEKLRELKLEVPVKAGEKGRLFGAVTAHQIADLIRDEGIELDRHALHLREPSGPPRLVRLGDVEAGVRRRRPGRALHGVAAGAAALPVVAGFGVVPPAPPVAAAAAFRARRACSMRSSASPGHAAPAAVPLSAL